VFAIEEASVTDEKFASIKLSRAFVTWLKIEAAKAGVPMYKFVEKHFKSMRPQ
jgi:hypothetical protein